MLALVILVFVLVAAWLVVLFDGFFGKLDFASGSKAASQVIGILKQRHLLSGNFTDLGSAKGGFAVKIAAAFPNMQILGIDDSGFRMCCAKALAIFLKNTEFKKEDLFQTNVSSADAVYAYLPKELMPELQIKLQKELKSGAIVFTNKVSFPSWQHKEKINDIFIYVKQ